MLENLTCKLNGEAVKIMLLLLYFVLNLTLTNCSTKDTRFFDQIDKNLPLFVEQSQSKLNTLIISGIVEPFIFDDYMSTLFAAKELKQTSKDLMVVLFHDEWHRNIKYQIPIVHFKDFGVRPENIIYWNKNCFSYLKDEAIVRLENLDDVEIDEKMINSFCLESNTVNAEDCTLRLKKLFEKKTYHIPDVFFIGDSQSLLPEIYENEVNIA